MVGGSIILAKDWPAIVPLCCAGNGNDFFWQWASLAVVGLKHFMSLSVTVQ